MNNDFIHTFALSYRDSFENIMDLTKNITFIKIDGIYTCTDYCPFGITIYSLPCPNECRDGKGNHKLFLKVNPSRLVDSETYSNKIEDYSDLSAAIDNLNIMISNMFPSLILNDFKLVRLDITRDIRFIPEPIIQEYILLMRTMTLGYGCKHNTELEENTEDFRIEDSFNVVNNSQGVEFVVYNKHRAAVDQEYPKRVRKYYKNTMRVEIRLNRRYIRKHASYLDTDEAIFYFYNNREMIFKDFYSGIFKYPTDLCFVSSDWQERFIHRAYPDSAKERKMTKIILSIISDRKNMDRYSYETYHTKKSKIKKLSPFSKLGFSPIPVINEKISFLSSLDTLFGFNFHEGNEMEKNIDTDSKKLNDEQKENIIYHKIKHSKGRKKVMFYVGNEF